MPTHTALLGAKYLGRLFLRYIYFIIPCVVIVSFDAVTYTYVPMFTQYVFSLLETLDPALVKSDFALWIKELFNFFGGLDLMKTVITVAAFLAIYQVFRALYKVGMRIFIDFSGETISRNLRYDLYAHIQKLPYIYHKSADLGDLIQRCTSDIDAVQNVLVRNIPDALSVFAVIFSAVFKIAAISGGKLTVVSLMLVPVTFISSLVFCFYIQKKYDDIEKEEAKLMTILQENVGNVRVVKAFNNEQYELKRFEDQNTIYAAKNLAIGRKQALYWGFSDLTTILQITITLVAAIFLTKDPSNNIKTADIIAIVTLVGTYTWPIRRLGRIIADTGKAFISAGRINELLLIEDEFKDNGTLTTPILGNVTFDDVHFKFDDTPKHLLNGISFSVKAGETVAIVGKTGSGKSTIAKLLVRLNDYQKGQIYLDGTPITSFNKTYLRQQVGLILQDPFLFSRTVKENIAIAHKQSETTAIYQAAKLAAIENDILGFENGYDTLVGEKGATLSGGQKQRIAIARMLIDNKPIIIFDDSLSALDTHTDLMIRKALKEKTEKSTLFIITHRITTARQADKIIIIDNGRVTDIGTHEELANKPGLYQKLWSIQERLEKEFLEIFNAEEKHGRTI